MEDIHSSELILIGEGNHSRVFLIRGTSLAVKVPVEGAEPQQMIEAQIYTRLGSHANLLNYRGSVEVVTSKSRDAGMLLDYCKGDTLAAVLEDNSLLSKLSHHRSKWSAQLTQALAFIHSKGIVHGDFGTHNILLDEKGSLNVIDFGGSRLDGSRCLSFPSPRYRRVPSWLEETYEPEVKDDIFALGMVLCEIQIGRHAYQGMTYTEVLNHAECCNFPDLDNISVPRMKEIIHKCLLGGYDSALGVVKDIEDLDLASMGMD